MGTDEDSKIPLLPPAFNPNASEATRVDLGDDLLIPATPPAMGGPEGGAAEEHSSDDQYQSARILINEGFTEDAKKLLRKILITDPHHVAARNSLGEILNREMQDLL